MSAQRHLPPKNGANARRGPWVPARPLLRLVQRRLEGEPIASRLMQAGCRGNFVRDIEDGRQEFVSFDTADKIVAVVLNDPSLWRSELFLRRVIEA